MLRKKSLVVLCAVLLGACATPKYSYHFGKHTYQAAAIPSEQNPVEKGQSTNSNETISSPVHEEQAVIYASANTEKVKSVIAHANPVNTKTAKYAEPKSVSFNTNAERKQAKAALKKAAADYKAITKADGVEATKGFARNQIVALVLAIFFGGLGVHRFYLGKIGSGIVFFLLAMTSFLIVPGVALLIWLLIDIIRIAMGRLKPKGGDYETTF